MILDRADAYIGVMIDDMVLKGITEPFRMFTSRAELRFSLRSDNADQRLHATGMAFGCIGRERDKAYREKLCKLGTARDMVMGLSMTPSMARGFGIKISQDGVRRTALELLSYPNINMDFLQRIWPELGKIDKDIAEQVEIDARYSVYLERQNEEIRAFRKDENLVIDGSIDYRDVIGLSRELQEKLIAVRPENLGQASRIDGMTPTALTSLLRYVKKREVKPRP
jgi:tRNA uridine 5-carboxymethylaminomethyl modification enzyme